MLYFPKLSACAESTFLKASFAHVKIKSCNISISLIKSKVMYCNTEDSYYSWLKRHLEQQEQKVDALKAAKKNKGDEF